MVDFIMTVSQKGICYVNYKCRTDSDLIVISIVVQECGKESFSTDLLHEIELSHSGAMQKCGPSAYCQGAPILILTRRLAVYPEFSLLWFS